MLALLIAASAFAGWIDAVIGGGGLVLIPVLMATTGMPTASVLATAAPPRPQSRSCGRWACHGSRGSLRRLQR